MQLTKLDIVSLTGVSIPFAQIDRRAWGYGNEVEVGKALKVCNTPRSDIFVTVLLLIKRANKRPNYGERITLKCLKGLKIPSTNLVSNTLIVSPPFKCV